MVTDAFSSTSRGIADIFAFGRFLSGSNILEHLSHIAVEASRVLVPNCVNLCNYRVRLYRLHGLPP